MRSLYLPQELRAGRVSRPEDFQAAIGNIKHWVKEDDAIAGALIYGSGAGDVQLMSPMSDLDAVILLNKPSELTAVTEGLAKSLSTINAETNFTVVTKNDLRQKTHGFDPFLTKQLVEGPGRVFGEDLRERLVIPKNINPSKVCIDYLVAKLRKLKEDLVDVSSTQAGTFVLDRRAASAGSRLLDLPNAVGRKISQTRAFVNQQEYVVGKAEAFLAAESLVPESSLSKLIHDLNGYMILTLTEGNASDEEFEKLYVDTVEDILKTLTPDAIDWVSAVMAGVKRRKGGLI
jgi:hypothetical protein